MTAAVTYQHKINELSIFFDVDDLKNILSFKQDKIEDFINNAMHEQGHVIQANREDGNVYRRKNDRWYTGLKVNEYDKENQTLLSSRGIIINEIAEVINAERLQTGNISRDQRMGYYKVQNVGRVILSSLGISEMELARLQLKGRNNYEKCIANKLGMNISQIYIYGFEEIVDSIHNFSYDKKQRRNLILQINALQSLSKSLFEERFENIMQNSNDIVGDLARLSIDKANKDNALFTVFDEFKIEQSELQEDIGIDIHDKLSEQGYSDDYILQVCNSEVDERLKMQEEINKQNEYNNEELREKLYQSFLRYPIKNVPLKDRPGVILSKVIGRVKRRELNRDTKLLLSGEEMLNQDKYTKFRDRVANIEEYELEKIASKKDIRAKSTREVEK